mmetsp:Transcript_9193/g.13372  ORF Transcript_9193/g.13372 Transcript_9193/m.13372 type:complete len:403 (+) Transcript_9193:133-1341(+)|eukprot:CAMPEP_0195534688 /NCGR_PEP_ID=MMETSP0794_2-20130614/42832_1 /TAXON_ID=515487 /ORGANISM="Stephanopyxis turris, Strain CCMP 815" /LENGTH=402 /DNA_ID=CAMNT_0040667597 /DNA_START=65 /DNA_END=1273 /DNA_ORIENTATION=-
MPSVKTHPKNIGKENSDVLIGTGERSVKMGFMQINVYSLGLYVDPSSPSFRIAFASYSGVSSHKDLIDDEAGFYRTFVNGGFRKTFRLVFCRTISREKLVNGFAEPLRARVDEEHSNDAEHILEKLVPQNGVADDDMLTIVYEGDGESLVVNFSENKTKQESELVRMKSGGEGGVWRAFQNIFFDSNTAIPDIRRGAVSGLHIVLAEQEQSIEKQEKVKESVKPQQPFEVAVEDANAVPKSPEKENKKNWSDWAVREGDPNYKFGDITRGIVATVSGKTQKADKHEPISKTRDQPELFSTQNENRSEQHADVEELKKTLQVHKDKINWLEADIERHRKRISDLEERIQEAYRLLPPLLVFVLLMSKLLAASSFGFNLLVYVVLIVASGLIRQGEIAKAFLQN